MYDAQITTVCKHRIQDEILSVVETVDGIKATLAYPAVMEKSQIFIRSWNDQVEFLNNAENFKAVQIPVKGVNYDKLPAAGLIKQLGITAYSFEDERTLVFDKAIDPLNPHFPDPNPNYVPKNIYVVDYTADPQACPICRGTGIITDLNVSSSGKMVLVTKAEKIKQRVLKALLTPSGGQPYTPGFGSELDDLIGNNIVSDFSRMGMNKTISDCVQQLINMQDGNLPDDERIVVLTGITIESKTNNPDAINIKITVKDAEGTEIPVYLGFSLGDFDKGWVA